MKTDLNKIAKEISELESMPNDETYHESCMLVAQDLYGLDWDSSYEVAEIIQNKYL